MKRHILDALEAKPLECGSGAAAFYIVININGLKAAAALPHSKAPFGRSSSAIS